MRLTLPRLILAALALAALALPYFATNYYTQFASKAAIMAVAAIGLNLAAGAGGMVSMCHAAFFGLAGYTLALLSPQYEAASLFLTLPAAVAISALAAALIGALSLRTRGVYFIMVTLAFGEMLFFVFHDTPLGGSDGKFIYVKPEAVIGGYALFDLEKTRTFYYAALAALAFSWLIAARLKLSHFGHALAAARDNERRALALGFPVFKTRLIAFTISGALAGLAGYFSAAQFGFIAPQALGWHASATLLVMILLGGMKSSAGPVIGAVALLALEEVLKLTTDQWKLWLGLIVIALVLLLPGGLSQLGVPGWLKKPGEAPRG